MNMRTTDDWEALLKDATPGPWPHNEHECGPLWGGFDGRPSGSDADENLVVVAPEAVAEVIRLRRELENLHRECIESAVAAEWNARNEHNREALEAVAYADRDTADAITRILGGEQ